MDLLPCSVSLTFDEGQGGGQGGCLVWFWLLILRPDAVPGTNNTLLVPGPRRYSLRRSIVMPDRRANYIILLYSTLFYYILLYFKKFCSVLFYSVYSTLFYSI